MARLPRVFAPRSITAKLTLMAAAGALFMVLVAITVLLIARSELVAERTEKAHAVVDSVWNMADNFQHAVESGTLSADEAKARFFAAAGGIWWEGHTNYAFIYDTQTALNLMNTGNKATVGKDMRGAKDSNGLPFASMMFDIAKRQGEGTIRYAFPKGTNPVPQAKIAYFREFVPWHMLIVSAEYIADIDDTFWTMTRTAGEVIGVLLLVSLGIAWSVGRSIVRPLSMLRARMGTLREGDLEAAIPGADRHDELGEMARAVLVFKEHMVRETLLAGEHESVRQQAEQAQRHAALVGMANTVEAETATALESIGLRTTAMAATAAAMSASATRTGDAAQDAAGAAGQALANAQTVASAAEELAASIREIGGQVSQSAAIVGRAVTAGADARGTIEALNQEVERIGAVADMIAEIAAKTNLLALNATIEAARAGDAGKGFAVVAAEVKALATQTAHSTREIGRHIGQVRTATGASVAAVTQIEDTISEINAIAGSIAAAVEQQGAATAEIARNVTETANAANEMTSRTKDVSAEAVDTGRLATDVRDNIVALDRAVEELRHSVIRVVRTSTSDVDRRQTQRYQMVMAATLAAAGRSGVGVQVIDLSEGGASVQDGPELAMGTRCTLRLEGVSAALPCAVRAADGGSLHLAFTLDDRDRAQLRPVLERLGQRLAA